MSALRLRLILSKATPPISGIGVISSCNFCSSSPAYHQHVSSISKGLGFIGGGTGTGVGATSNFPHRRAILFPSLVPSSVTYQPQRNAGHSKWANIKHVKTANDQAKSKEITKYISYIKVAIRETGNADPKTNSRLAQVIQQIKEAKLPMATVDKCLQSYQNKKPSQSCIYPIRGPGNCVMLIDLESPTVSKTKQELNTLIRKNKGKVTDDSVLHMFEHKGVLYCSEINGKPVTEDSLDEATMHAIEAGANDVTFIPDHPEHGQVLEFMTEPSAFFKVKGSLEAFKYDLTYADVEYIPKICQELEDAEVEAANTLYTKLTEHPDVQKIYVNIA